jgi:hypothetical protein
MGNELENCNDQMTRPLISTLRQPMTDLDIGALYTVFITKIATHVRPVMIRSTEA